MRLARTDHHHEQDWLIDDFSLRCLQSVDRLSVYKGTLFELLSIEPLAQSRDDVHQLLDKVAYWLPQYESYTSFFKYPNRQVLQHTHKELAYLLVTHPDFLQHHPLFFGLQQEIVKVISQKIWTISEYDHRIQNMQKYLYRLPHFWFIKEKNWFLTKMQAIYDNPYFLSNSLHEMILVDMIAKDLFPECTVWLASNIDDRRFWFDAIVMSPQQRFCFIDFTFSDDPEKLQGKRNKMKAIAGSKRKLYDSEFAICLFEQMNISLFDKKRKWVVFQVNKTTFEQQWLPDYIQYVFPWINNRLHASNFITCNEMNAVQKLMR